MIRGPLAVVLALLVAISPVARAADANDPTGVAECAPGTTAPETSARLRWRSPNGGEGAVGTWVSDPAMNRAAARMKMCNTGWSTCEVNLAVANGKRVLPGWKAWAIGIGAGIALGYTVGRIAR